MRDCELYRRILGIEAPWYVDRVELKLGEGEIHVYVEHGEQAEWTCPECGVGCRLYDHQGDRRWRHLDTCQYRIVLHARPPRAECREHGIRVVKLPWAEAASRFTALFEALAIEWLKEASQQAVGKRLGLSWEEIHGIMERAVARSRLGPMIAAGRMLKRRLENVLTYRRHRITNAASESMNSKIQWVKYTARGFRNVQNFVHAIYFHCGGLDLAPSPAK